MSAIVEDDNDLRGPRPGHEMASPEMNGVCANLEMMQNVKLEKTMAHIDGMENSDRLDIEKVRERKEQRRIFLEKNPDIARIEQERIRQAEKLPDIVSYGFSKLVYDFLDALHNRFPQRRMLQRTLEHYWQIVERCPYMPFSKFNELVQRCDAKNRNMFDERTPENEAMVVAELMQVPLFKMAKLDCLYCPQLDEDTKVKIWNYVSRLVQITKLMAQFNPRLRSLLNKISMDSLNCCQGKDKRDIDVETLLSELQDRLLEDEELLDEIVELAQNQM